MFIKKDTCGGKRAELAALAAADLNSRAALPCRSLLSFKKNFKMSKPQLKPSRDGQGQAEGGRGERAGRCPAVRTKVGNNMWKFSACRLQATVDAGLLPASFPLRPSTCSTRLELDTCACLHCRVYCTIYKPCAGQARRRPYGQLMHAMVPEYAATPRCLRLPHCLCHRTFPLIFLYGQHWLQCGHVEHGLAAVAPRDICKPPARQRFLFIYSWPVSIDESIRHIRSRCMSKSGLMP